MDVSFTLAAFTFCLILPPFTVIFLRSNTRRLENEEFRKSYGEIYEGYRAEVWGTKWYLGFFFLRRLVFALSTVHLSDNPALQIQLYTLLSLLNVIAILAIKPFEGATANRVEVFNELTILTVATHLFAFTLFVPAESLQNAAGTTLMAVVLGNVLFHLVRMLYVNGRFALLVLRKVYRILVFRYSRAKIE